MTAGLELTPGTRINGRYRIQRVLGRGGFGRTYLAADDRRFGDACVLKEFAPSSQSDPIVAQKLRELFQREATVLHKLNHPQIPQFFAVLEEDGRLFIVQEYINGKTYWRVLQERQQYRKTFSEIEIVQWLKDLLKVLDYLHSQNIVHRDIAPDNIMLPRGKKLPVLIDFGVVKQVATHFYGMSAVNADGLIQASVSVGKFGYAPYEQIRMGQCSPKSDLYALAVTAVVLLTGKPPNLLIDPRSLEWQWQTKVRLNPRLVEILEKMMAEKPHDRYPSAKIILRELHLLGQSVHNLGAVPQHPAGRNLHPRYRSDIALPSSQLSHTGIKLVSPPHGLPPLHHEAALPLPQVGALTTQITSAHIATLESTHAETPTQVATQIVASDNETKVQSYTELLRSGLYTPTSRLSHGSTSSRATQVTTLPYTTSRVLIREPHKPYIQLKNVLALGLLALLPVSGMLLGVQSPYIASACQLLNNCAGDEQSEIRYRHAVEQAVGAKTLSENAHNLVDLQHARDRLADSLAQLGSMSGGTKIYAEAQQALLNYRNTLEQLETHLEKETRAAQLLKRAEAEAEKATEQTKAAQTVESYKTAELQWRRALMTLRTVQPDTFASNQVAARLQEYSARLQAVSLRIPGSPKPYSQATEWLQPRVIQSARLPQSTGAPNSSGTPSQQSNFQANVAPNSLRQGPTFQASGQAIASPPNQSGQTQLISNLRLDPTSGASSNVPGRFPASSRSRAGNSSSAEVPVRQVLAPAAASSNISRQSRLAQPMPIAAAPNNPFNSALFTGSAPLSAFQTLNDVSLGLDGAWINPGGTYVANLVLENYSQRPFGFVPLFAEVRDASGQAVQSRILLRGSEDGVVEPGETLRGQLFLLDRHWNNAGSQNLTLVIQEGTSGSRNFHLPF